MLAKSKAPKQSDIWKNRQGDPYKDWQTVQAMFSRKSMHERDQAIRDLKGNNEFVQTYVSVNQQSSFRVGHDAADYRTVKRLEQEETLDGSEPVQHVEKRNKKNDSCVPMEAAETRKTST